MDLGAEDTKHFRLYFYFCGATMRKIFKKNSAFTLIEILLGFLIFSIILVVLYSTFFSGMKIEERSVRDAAAYHQAKMSLDMMGRELEEAVMFNFENFSLERKAFEGSQNKISFLTPGKNGLVRVSYYLEDKDITRVHQTLIGGRYQKNVQATDLTSEAVPPLCLVRSEEPLVDLLVEGGNGSQVQEILFDNVRRDSFGISYAYLESAGENPRLVWKNAWANEYIPSGVRFELTIEPFKKADPPLHIKKDVYIPAGFWGEES